MFGENPSLRPPSRQKTIGLMSYGHVRTDPSPNSTSTPAGWADPTHNATCTQLSPPQLRGSDAPFDGKLKSCFGGAAASRTMSGSQPQHQPWSSLPLPERYQIGCW